MAFLRAVWIVGGKCHHFSWTKQKPTSRTTTTLPFAIHFEFQQLLNKIKITTSYYFGGDGEWHLKYILPFTNSRVLSLIEALNIENTAVANILCGVVVFIAEQRMIKIVSRSQLLLSHTYEIYIYKYIL